MKSFLDTIYEESGSDKHHVMTFGRMNPPTTGHMKLIDKVHEIAKKHNAEHTVVTSHTQDSKKNPLSAEQKLKHLRRYSPGTNFAAASKEHPTILHHAANLHSQGVTHLHVVVGSDRVKEMHHILHKYNGVQAGHGKYKFKKITVHSAGDRDPDAEGTEGMSASKMREHAHSGNHNEFRKGVPSHVSDKHSKELMHDVRKGMGLHENVNRGRARAIFITGGPGSGKDIVIRESIAESRIVELNFIQAKDYLYNKQKLSEKSNDFRREAIRNCGPLIINGPADDLHKISFIKEELESLGYETMMVFVNTTDGVSKERNSTLNRMMVESVRHDKWSKAQENTKYFSEAFKKFIVFDNTDKIESKEQDIHEVYLSTKTFLDSNTINESMENWFARNKKVEINNKINLLFREDKNVKVVNRFIQKQKTTIGRADGPGDITPDNSGIGTERDEIKGDTKARKDPNGKGHSGGAWHGVYSTEEITITKKSEPKEKNFNKDKEVIKKNRFTDSPSVSQRMRNVATISPEFDTRQQGTVYPMSGLGNVTYREQKDFNGFRKTIKEYNGFQNDTEMGVGGVLGSSTNKEPMQTYKDLDKNVPITIKKKKKVQNV